MQSVDFVISKFIVAALNNQPITIYGDGSQTRTFCYISDNLDMTIKTWQEGHFINDVVNVGSDDEQSVLSMAQLVVNVLNSKSEIVHLPPLKEGDMARRKPDVTKMRKVLGRELVSLKEGISRVAAFLK